MTAGIVHLRACTEYSLLYSAARIAELAKRARADGMTALGFADRGGMYGALTAYRTIAAAGVQPILGAVVEVVPERSEAMRESREICLIADSFRGYRSLVALASLAAAALPEGRFTNTWEEVAAHREGLICLTGGLRGPLGPAVRDGDGKEAMRVLRELKAVFGSDSLYVELMDHGLAEEREANRRFAQAARHANVPIVATFEIRHSNPEDLVHVDLLQAVKDGDTLSEAAAKRPPGGLYPFLSQSEMRERFQEYPEGLAATAEIAGRAKLKIPLHTLQMPRFPLPSGETEDFALSQKARDGLAWRGMANNSAYRERLQDELSVIARMGFSGYFLIVWDFMRFAHEQGISTGPGRGSAAGSLVAYALAITDIDPVAHDLLFERFLNPERVSLPDIDIDFETERRYEVIAYVARKYGSDRVAQIGTLGTFAARAAIRDAARAVGLAQSETEELIGCIPATPGATIEKAMASDERLVALLRKNPGAARVVTFARAIEGLPRHTSVHAAGVVISAEPLNKWVPVMRGPDEIPVTQYSMEDVEALGLLKMDFLGLRTLTICDRALKYVREARGRDVTYDDMETNPEMLALLAAGDTDGCFQLESEGVKSVLRDMRPETLEDLIAVISLYRPGPMEQIKTYLRARREGAIAVLIPEIEPILRRTYGVIVYQEQIMQIAAVMAGFSLGQADLLRRAVAKKKREELDLQRESFVAGCLSRGHLETVAQQVYDLIVRFADYGFNRSHAAAYAVLAMRTAYLKANFRPEFMAALITDTSSRPDKVAQYALACRRVGIALLGPDVNRSFAETAPEVRLEGDPGIRLGLFTVRNVGQSAVLGLLLSRESDGPFASFGDLVKRLDTRAVTKRVLESLVQSGACDGFGQPRRELLRQLAATDRPKGRGSNRQMSLMADVDEPMAVEAGSQDKTRPLVDDMREREAWERTLIGFVVSRDPFTEVARCQTRLGVVPLDRLAAGCVGAPTSNGAAVQLVGRMEELRQVRTKRGESMAFLTLEDETAQIEIVVFPAIFRVLNPLPQVGEALVVAARCETGPKPSWIAQRISLVADAISHADQARVDVAATAEPARSQGSPPRSRGSRERGGTREGTRLYIKIGAELEGDRVRLESLRQALLRHPGSIGVSLLYASGKIRPLQAVRVADTPELRKELAALAGAEAARFARGRS